ncbi:MAG TPA: SAVED domain-containing protein [Ktedonobacteraceae bacterium]|jgi:hypothetical protein
MFPQQPDHARPATVFLSYAREDIEAVKKLQIQLKLRGIRAWRDVTDLPPGTLTRDEIEHVIEHEIDAMVLYVTPASLNSRYIWTVEVPAAVERHKRDPHFRLVPLLDGVSYIQMREASSDWLLDHNLSGFNGIPLTDDPRKLSEIKAGEMFGSIARDLLKSALTVRLHRIGADRTYEPTLCLHNFHYTPPADSLDLDLNWCDLFPDKIRIPTTEEWEQILLPALHDVKQVLSEQIHSRHLRIFIQSILPLALALGFVFSQHAHFSLSVETDRYGTWSSEGKTSKAAPLHSSTPIHNNGDPQIAALVLAITRATERDTSKALMDLNIQPGHHLHLVPSSGPSNDSIRTPAQALAAARQVRQVCNDLCDRQGVGHIHLFVASSAPLAVLIGHLLGAHCPISIYEFSNHEKVYKLVGQLVVSPSSY